MVRILFWHPLIVGIEFLQYWNMIISGEEKRSQYGSQPAKQNHTATLPSAIATYTKRPVVYQIYLFGKAGSDAENPFIFIFSS